MTPDLCDHLRVQHVLSLRNVLVVSDDGKTGLPQFRWEVVGPKVSVCEYDRIRRRNM
jgi:hypothetical protein